MAFEPLPTAQARAAYDSLSPEGKHLVDALVGKMRTERISIGWFELFTTLVYKKQIGTGSLVSSVNVPAGATLQIVQPVSSGQVIAQIESRITFSADHMLQYSLQQDGNQVYQDLDMVFDNYRSPINFYRLNSPLYVTKQFTDSFTNIGYVPVVVNEVSFFGTIVQEAFDDILDEYYDMVFDRINAKRGI